MTAPTISYGHGFLDDCSSTTGWTETESGLAATLAVENDDIFKITGTMDNAADEYVTYEKDITNISTDLYPKLLVRWKTTLAAAGLQAKINAVYTVGNTSTTLGFSTAWTTTTIDLTAGKTLDKIQLIADDNPDSTATGTDYIYFDFIMVCKGVFTFPYISGKVHFEQENVYAEPPISSRIGRPDQYMGMNNSDIVLDGKIDINTGYCSDSSFTTQATCEAAGKTWIAWSGATRTAAGVYCEYLRLIMQEAASSPFQWFTSNIFKGKVTPRRIVLDQDGESLLAWQFYLKQGSRSGGQLATWDNLQFWGV